MTLRRLNMGVRLATRLSLCFAPLLPVGCTEPEKPVVSPAARQVDVPSTARASLRGIQGDVQVKRAADDSWAAGMEGMALYENDKVRTVAGAGVQVMFANGSNVTVGENALVSVAETQTRPGEERSDLTVFEGRIDAELPDADKQSLTVSTPAARVRAGREIVFQ